MLNKRKMARRMKPKPKRTMKKKQLPPFVVRYQHAETGERGTLSFKRGNPPTAAAFKRAYEQQRKEAIDTIIVAGRKSSDTDVLDQPFTYFVSSEYRQRWLQELHHVIPSDARIYPRSMIAAPTFSATGKKEMKQRQVKIVKKIAEGNKRIVKFITKTQINWGHGPTLPSLYAYLYVNTKEISPIYHKSLDMEKEIIAGKLPLENEYGRMPYESILPEQCRNCWDRVANVMHDDHFACCESCMPYFNFCPFCRAFEPTFREMVEFL